MRRGLNLWNSDRPTALDAVLQQVNNYSKFGFKPIYHHLRYQGIGQAGAIPEGIVWLRVIPFAEVVSYDNLYFPASRPAFLNTWSDRS